LIVQQRDDEGVVSNDSNGVGGFKALREAVLTYVQQADGQLSEDKLARVRDIRYEEPERTRQNDLLIDRSERRVILRDA